MQHAVLAAVLAAALGLPGTASAQTATTQPKSEMSPTTKSQMTDKTGTQRYVHDAAIADMFEVQAGKLAIVKARDNSVADFARMMVKNHTASTKKIKDALAASKTNIKPPAKLDAEHQKMLDQLKAAGPERFDRMYMDMQVKGHNQALALHQSYAANGQVPELKKAAGEIVPVVQHHLADANKVTSAMASNPAAKNTTTKLPRKGS